MFDLDYLKNSNTLLAGLDEVGRGPLAGPVVGASFSLICREYKINEIKDYLEFLNTIGVTDSKKLTDKKREAILEKLSINVFEENFFERQISKNIFFKLSIQEIQVDTIDKINILNASLLAMKNAFYETSKDFTGEKIILIDGNKKIKNLSVEQFPIVKGDSKSILIGLASIAAKVYRDSLMKKYDEIYPGYGFCKHAGYPTSFHLTAIREIGVTKIHRKTFRGVKEFYEEGRPV